MKDIVDRIDELLPIVMAGAAFASRSGVNKPDKLDRLFTKVARKKVEAGGLMQAVDIVAKEQKLNKRWEKKLRKYVKQFM